MSFLTLENVTHYYFSKNDYTKALDDVSLSIEEGEFVSIIGPSGCGKSTILSIVAKLMKHTDGNILLKNKPLQHSNLKVGYMLQQDYLFPWKTIMENILIGPKINGTIHTTTEETGLELLKEVGIRHVAKDYPDALSGGMRQRVAFVRTFIDDPHI